MVYPSIKVQQQVDPASAYVLLGSLHWPRLSRRRPKPAQTLRGATVHGRCLLRARSQLGPRSEERRVGKEWRSRWVPEVCESKRAIGKISVALSVVAQQH